MFVSLCIIFYFVGFGNEDKVKQCNRFEGSWRDTAFTINDNNVKLLQEKRGTKKPLPLVTYPLLH